jgi:hypothetical protein
MGRFVQLGAGAGPLCGCEQMPPDGQSSASVAVEV